MATSTYLVDADAPVGTSGQTHTRFYAPELDALRFAAFLLVFCRHFTNALGGVKNDLDAKKLGAVPAISANVSTHASLLSSIRPQEVAQALDFGVCLFFFLSSFLITRLLLIEREDTGSIHIGQFYMRRCLRIWPLYFFFLALVVILSQFVPVLHVSVPRVLAAGFFVGNWAAVLHGWSSIAIQPLWSVSVEEQFYLVWPGFARFGRRSIVAVSLVMGLLSMLTLFYFGHISGAQVTATWPNTLVQALFLAAGALTACFSFPERRRLSDRKRVAFLFLGAVCWLTASAGCHIVRTQSPGAAALMVGYLLVLCGTMLMFNGVAGWNARPMPALLLYLGKISYGLYVFHVACLLFMGEVIHGLVNRLALHSMSPYLVETISAALALALTIACASCTYEFLERPFLKLKGRFTRVRSRPV